MVLERMRADISFRMESLRHRLMKRRMGLYLLVNITLIIFLSALITFSLERGKNPGIHSYWDALYMVFITIATVGYGDITPVTAGGRVVILLTIALGFGTLSAFITLIATRRAEKTRRRYAGLHDMTKSINHILVCGWNPRGRYVINRLKEELEGKHTQIVLMCDLEDSPVDDDAVLFLRGNPVSEADLRRTNVVKARAVILLADENRGGHSGDVDARTVLSALTIKGISPDAKMTAEVLEPENIHHLRLAGVGEILDTNLFLGNLIARSALNYGLINLVSGMVTKEAGMHLFTVDVDSEMVGKTWAEMETRLLDEYQTRLLAIAKDRKLVPEEKGYRIEEGDILLVISEEKPPATKE